MSKKPTSYDLSSLASHIATEGLEHIRVHLRMNYEFGEAVYILERYTKAPLCLTYPGQIKGLEEKVSNQLAFARAVHNVLDFLGYKSTTLHQRIVRKANELAGFQKLDVIVSNSTVSNLFPCELK